MKEAEKIICPTDIGCESQAASILNYIRRAKSASGYQNAELKRLAFRRPYLIDAMSLLRDTRPVSMSAREAHEVHISQLSLGKCDNQQREICISSQQRYETRVSKPKRESRVHFTECELRISEPCAFGTWVSELRHKVNIRSRRLRPEGS